MWTRASVRQYDGRIVPTTDPLGRELYWFTVTPIEGSEEGTDRWAVEQGWISLTPLRLDLTDEARLADVRRRVPLDEAVAAGRVAGRRRRPKPRARSAKTKRRCRSRATCTPSPATRFVTARATVMDFVLAGWPELTPRSRRAAARMRAVLGGLIGSRARSSAGKAAGIRTHMMVALGAALFVWCRSKPGFEPGDLQPRDPGHRGRHGLPRRRHHSQAGSSDDIEGLTSAATIWFTGAIGIAVGAGAVLGRRLGVVCAWVVLRVALGAGSLGPSVARLTWAPRCSFFLPRLPTLTTRLPPAEACRRHHSCFDHG